jgi:hypothetical protein
MKYSQSNKEENIMNAKHGISDRITRKPERRHVSRLILAAMLALGFSVPEHATAGIADSVGRGIGRAMRANYEAQFDMNVTLATITVPVRLHNFPEYTSNGVTCKVYDRNHRELPAEGRGGGAPAVVNVHPRKGSSVAASQLVSWKCLLEVMGRDMNSGLVNMYQHGTRFRPSVEGNF